MNTVNYEFNPSSYSSSMVGGHRKSAHRKSGHRKSRHRKSMQIGGDETTPQAFGMYGNGQPYSNVPFSNGYSSGGNKLHPVLSAMANPPPITSYYAYQSGGKRRRNRRTQKRRAH